MKPGYNTNAKYVPTCCRRNAKGEEIYHKDNPSKVFDSALENFRQELVDDMFEKNKDIYCSVDLLHGCVPEDEIEAVKKYSNEIAEIFKKYTTDRVNCYNYLPFDRY